MIDGSTPDALEHAVLDLDVRLALDRFELRVELGLDAGVTALFGPSGAGKSSLLEVVAGLRRGARGRIALGGEIWLDSSRRFFVPPEGRGIGWVSQEGLLFPHWTVRRNLLAGARSDGSQTSREKLLSSAVELLELGPLLERSPNTLSGGERQRVALGRALCSSPRLLLLDEPLAALDLSLRRRLLGFLRRVRRELTVPMLLVSHDPVEVQALADEVVVLREGAITRRGEPRAVLSDPALFASSVDEGLVGASYENVLPGVLRPGDAEAGGRRVRLGVAGEATELLVLHAPEAVEKEVLVGLPASDILLASERPRGLSARNVLPATVEALRPGGASTWVVTRLAGDVELTVEVTERTPAELGLEIGGAVFLVIKAASVRIYGDA